MKNSQEGFRGRFEQTEERTHELQDTTMEILKSEEQRKALKEREQTLEDLWDTIHQTIICIVGVPEGAKRKRQREYLKK